MGHNTKDQLDLFAGAIPASHLALPGSEKARQMTAISGQNFTGLLESQSPLGLLQKMLLDTSLWASTVCWLTWKVRAINHKHFLFQLVPSVPHTEETEYGLWLGTPTAEMSVRSPGYQRNTAPNPAEFVKLWPTPTGSQARSEGLINQMRAKVDSREITREEAEQMIGGSLTPQRMKFWPTPTTQETEHPETELTETGRRKSKNDKGSHGLNLADTVRMWPTPRAQARSKCFDRGEESRGNLEEVIGKDSPGQLNPQWVEWLMGYPEGWTDLEG